MASKSRWSFIPAIASQSLGRAAYHSIEAKLESCSRHGFRGIEIFFEDLDTASQNLPKSQRPLSPGTSFSDSNERDERLLTAASYIHDLCRHHGLEVICLQPFLHYGGLIDRVAHASQIRELKLWIRLADLLHTDLIQVPTSFLPESDCSSDRSLIISDFREMADIGLQHKPHPIRFAHEALAWGTHVDTWDQVWEIVKAVDRPNFGTCIDTFNLAGRVYADPARADGKNPTAAEDFRRSLERMRADLDVSKVFYLEVVDAERLDQPLDERHPWYTPDQPARMTWSRNARLFPFEEGGYLPILDVVKVICTELGYRGYVSLEFFSRTMSEPGSEVPEEHARRAQVSWRKLVEYMGWNGDVQDIHDVQEGSEKPSTAPPQPKSPSVTDRSPSSWSHQRPPRDPWREDARSMTPSVC